MISNVNDEDDNNVVETEIHVYMKAGERWLKNQRGWWYRWMGRWKKLSHSFTPRKQKWKKSKLKKPAREDEFNVFSFSSPQSVLVVAVFYSNCFWEQKGGVPSHHLPLHHLHTRSRVFSLSLLSPFPVPSSSLRRVIPSRRSFTAVTVCFLFVFGIEWKYWLSLSRNFRVWVSGNLYLAIVRIVFWKEPSERS